MNGEQGRKQMTKGAWMGKPSQDSNGILVLDVEGLDSRERNGGAGVLFFFFCFLKNYFS
jgi:hypothetical protein